MPPKKPANAAPRLSSRQRREIKDMARREKLMRQKPPGPREKLLSGCLALLILGGAGFIIALVVTLIRRALE